MGIELRIEKPTEAILKEAEGCVIEAYRFQAYRDGVVVGLLEVNRIRSTANEAYRASPLFFDGAGNAQPYQASLQVNTPSYKDNETPIETKETAQEIADIGIALLKGGQAYCREKFQRNLLAPDGLETRTEAVVWGALLHGYDRSVTVMKRPPVKYFLMH